jgi:hypothetical protein
MPPIPPVFGWTAVAVAVVALSRAVVKEWRRVNEFLAAQRTPAQGEVRPDAIPTLRRDPRTGIFRPD